MLAKGFKAGGRRSGLRPAGDFLPGVLSSIFCHRAVPVRCGPRGQGIPELQPRKVARNGDIYIALTFRGVLSDSEGLEVTTSTH